MRKKQSFRPTPGDRLEDRTVPTSLGFACAPQGGIGALLGSIFGGDGYGGGGGGGTPAVKAQAVQSIENAFETFEQQYTQAARAAVSATTTTTTTPFSTTVGTLLTTLNSQIDKALATLGATGTALEPAVSADLLAGGTPPVTTTGATPLQTTLAGLKLPTTTSGGSFRSFEVKSEVAINRAEYAVTQLARNATPAGTITPQTVQALVTTVEGDLATFNHQVSTSLQSALSGTAATGSTPQATFDAAVTSAVSQLNTSVTGAVTTSLPALASTINPVITADLLSATPPATPDASLQGVLTGLTLPTGKGFFQRVYFQLQVSSDTGYAANQIFREITSAVRTYNNGLYATPAP